MHSPLKLFDKLEEPCFHSKHGGFWTDLSNAKDILNGKKLLGLVSDTEFEYLNFFIDNGYVILPQIIPSEVIDVFVDEIKEIKEGLIPGHFVEYFENGQYFYGKPYTSELANRSLRLKLLNVYSKSKLGRDVNLHPLLVRFLTLIFERPVLAFQSLSFFFGSQQSIHQDTAYVRVDSPMEMVASWIALEDIEEGSGELEFFVGSHKLPDYDFSISYSLDKNLQKWFKPGECKWYSYKNNKEHDEYLRWLVETSKNLKLKRKKFIARKGDVLIWTNDLSHGGTKVTKPEKSRLSLVTHYCPINRNPFYFYDKKHSEKIQHNEFGFFTYRSF